MTYPMHTTHTPAMTLSEAAMLPAQPGNLVMPRRESDFVPVPEAVTTSTVSAARPGRLIMPVRETDFIPVEDASSLTDASGRARRGSAAGRAILHAQGVSLPGVSAMSRAVHDQ